MSLSNSGSNSVALTDANALDLGTVGVSQNLTVTTGGRLTDTSAVTIVAGLGTIVSAGFDTTTDLTSTNANFEASGLLGGGGEHHRSGSNGSGGFGSDCSG